MQEAAHICSRSCIGHGGGGYSRNNWKGVESQESYIRNTQIPYNYYHLFSLSLLLSLSLSLLLFLFQERSVPISTYARAYSWCLENFSFIFSESCSIIKGWLMTFSHYIGVFVLVFPSSFYYIPQTDGKEHYSGVKNEKVCPSLPPYSIFPRIYLLKTSCGKRIKWHFRDLKAVCPQSPLFWPCVHLPNLTRRSCICSRHQEGVSIVLPQEPITYFHLYWFHAPATQAIRVLTCAPFSRRKISVCSCQHSLWRKMGIFPVRKYSLWLLISLFTSKMYGLAGLRSTLEIFLVQNFWRY